MAGKFKIRLSIIAMLSISFGLLAAIWLIKGILSSVPMKYPGNSQAARAVQAESDPTDYYVSLDGNNENNGKIGSPWRTIQKCADSLPIGSTCHVLAGEYPERVWMNRSGTSSKPIRYLASGHVVVHGFSIYADYISIKGFDITKTPDDSVEGWGIFIQGSYCDIEHNYIHFATRGGIRIYAPPGEEDKTKGCVVRNNRLYRNAMVGIEIHGQYNLIEGNEVWGTIQYHPSWTNTPDWADADGIRFFGSGHIIKKNYIHDILYSVPENINPHIDCFQTFTDSDYKSAQNIILEDNICKNAQVKSQTEFGKGFMLEDANQIILRNNIVTAFNHVNIRRDTDISIINNTFYADIHLVEPFDTSGVSIGDSSGVTIQNNIFYNLPNHIIYLSDGQSNQGLEVSFNDIYRDDGQPLWDNPYPHDLWGINPQFVNPEMEDYHLQATSPAIDAGTSSSIVPDDFEGTPRPQGNGVDIGAFEYLIAK